LLCCHALPRNALKLRGIYPSGCRSVLEKELNS
jgi:hypothetical protein